MTAFSNKQRERLHSLDRVSLIGIGIAGGLAVASCLSISFEGGFAQGSVSKRVQCLEKYVPLSAPYSPSSGLAVASAEWEQALQASGQSAWPKWRSAWLAGVCADSLGKASDAAHWMARFHQSFDTAREHFPKSDVLYLDIVATRLSPAKQAMTVPSPLGLFCLLAAAEPDPFPQVIDELKKARVAAASGSIIDRVRLMSWLLLAGELVVEADTGTPAAGLLRNAVQAFEEGFEILADVEKAIADDPSQESVLTSNADNALIAMRFDAVRVRQVAIKKREVLAKEKEFERLDALRELIAAEKAVMGQIGRLSMATMDRDWSGAKKAGESALEQIARTQEIARQKRDYYLLDEPKVVDTNDQWKAIDPPIGPISTDIVSTVKVLMGMAAAQLAETQFAAQVAGLRADEDIRPETDKEIATLLDVAETLVIRATEELDDDPVDGFDPENAIAPYVRGLIAETRARLATYQQLGDATAVKGEAERQQEAIKAYEALKPALEKWGADVTASYLLADAQRRLVAISDAAPAREAATSLSRSGKPAEAWAVLGNAAEVHASRDVAVDRADAARRSRMASDVALAELDRAVASRMIPNGDLAAAIARAAIVLDEVGTSLATRDNARPIEIDKKPLAEKLEPVESALRTAIDGLPADAPSRPRGWAWLALCLAYRSQVADDAAASSIYVKETQRLAQDALFELSKSPPEKDAWDPSYVEAVVAAQLALGHAAAKALPSHRDESRLAFAAAIDNATSLPFADADFRMLGSPLLAALAAGDSGGGVKLAQEERALRQMMTRFVEASFALRFGSPEQAASQMAEAVALGSAATNERKDTFDATTELSRADGFDVHLSLPDSIRAFAALSQTTAGEPATALRTLVAITSPEATLPADDGWLLAPSGQELIRESLTKIQSPLAAYAMASALESVVDRVELSQVEQMQPLLQLAIAAQKQTDSLLAASRVAGRYPHIQELSRQLNQRLADPAFHLTKAAEAMAVGALAEARDGLRAAIRRQPRAQALWRQLLGLEVSRLQHDKRPDAVRALRRELDTAARLNLLDPFTARFFSGELSLLENNPTQAANYFDSASQCAETPQQRAQAVARATASRLRRSESNTTKQSSNRNADERTT